MSMSLDRQYPLFPGYVDNDTSLEAAERIAVAAHSLRAKILEFIRKADDGATCDEVEVALRMRHQTASARVTELRLGKFIQVRGDKRLTRSGSPAKVYEVCCEHSD